MQAEGRYAALGIGGGAETGRGVLRRHFNTLAEHSVKVRQLLLNTGRHEGMKALAVQGGELYRKHTYAAPASGTWNPMVTYT